MRNEQLKRLKITILVDLELCVSKICGSFGVPVIQLSRRIWSRSLESIYSTVGSEEVPEARLVLERLNEVSIRRKSRVT